MEKLDIKHFGSQIKLAGTIVSVLGALIMTVYRGPRVWASMLYTFPQLSRLQPCRDWVLGGFCLVLAAFSIAGAIVLQSAAISLIVERDVDAWKLKADIKLVAIACAAVFNAVAPHIVAWCIGKKGPLFVAMFGPMGIVIAAPISAIFLGDNLTVGRVVGAVIIVSGFYAVVWAQSKDFEDENDQQCLDHLPFPSSSSHKIPLLQILSDQPVLKVTG